jgi:hypothetical protein
VVPPASHKLTGVRGTQGSNQRDSALLYGTLTRYGGAFQRLRVGRLLLYVSDPTTPLLPQKQRFGLVPPRSPLLRESRLISSRRATEMFQFARCPPLGLYIQPRVARHHSGGVAPFGISGLIARMQLPLNVSPVSASFIGLQRLGILLVLCLACLTSAQSNTLASSSVSRWLLSALGKIEVIMFYSVINVRVRVP